MKTTGSLIFFPLLVMILPLSTIFSSGIDTASAQEFSVVNTIPVHRSDAVAVNPTNGLVYVTSSFPSNTVSVINGTTNKLVTTIPVTSDPRSVAVNPTNGLVYVTNFLSNTVSNKWYN